MSDGSFMPDIASDELPVELMLADGVLEVDELAAGLALGLVPEFVSIVVGPVPWIGCEDDAVAFELLPYVEDGVDDAVVLEVFPYVDGVDAVVAIEVLWDLVDGVVVATLDFG